MKTRIQNAVNLFLGERGLAEVKILVWMMETENGIYFRLANRAGNSTEAIRPGTPSYFISAEEFAVVITSDTPTFIFDACMSCGALLLEATGRTLFGFPAHSYDPAPIRAEMWRLSREMET